MHYCSLLGSTWNVYFLNPEGPPAAKRIASSNLATRYWQRPFIGGEFDKNLTMCFNLAFRTINAKNSGSSIVERFQDEITGKVADITKEFLNR